MSDAALASLARRAGIPAFLVAVLLPAQAAAAVPGNLVIPRKEGPVSEQLTPPSIFPHWVHRINYRCDACHDRLFKMELGATEISMEKIKEGSCGTCHNGTEAFAVTFQTCNRCHRADDAGLQED